MERHHSIIWRLTLLICIIVIATGFAITAVRNTPVTFSSSFAKSFSDDWEFEKGDSGLEIDEHRNYLHISSDNGSSFVMTKTVPEKINEGMLLSFRTRAVGISLSVNGREFYDYTFEPTVRDALHFSFRSIPLPVLDKNDVLTLEIKSGGSDDIYIQNMCVGTRAEIINFTLRSNAAAMLIGFSMLIMAAVLFVIFATSVFARMPENSMSTLWLAAFSLLSAVWVITDFGLADLFISNRMLLYYANAVSFMLLPCCFLQFIKLNSFKREGFMTFLSIVDCVLVAINVLLYMFGIKDLIFNLFVFHILIAVGIVWVILKYVSGNMRVRLEIIVGIGSLFCFSVMNILTFWTNNIFPASALFGFGALTFAICMFILTIHNLVELQMSRLREQDYKNEKEYAVNKMLLTQISSHFFYNTMNTIRALIKTDTDAAYKMVGDFGKYMRFYIDSVNVAGGIIKFTNELVAVKAFADISAVQMGERLKMEYDIQCGDFDMPQLTVQPLVENAIKHGIGAKPEGGTVKLTVRETPDNYTVEVADNGKGFYTGKDAQKNSVAIKNIRQRLSHFRDCAMIIKSVPNEGSVITLLFPKKLTSGGEEE